MDFELTITVWDNRSAIRIAAKILKVRSDKVSVHVISKGNRTFRAISVDGFQQDTEVSKRALEFVRWEPLELPRRYRAPVETQ
jgi:hypothetical protein